MFIMGVDGISLEHGITGTEPAVVTIKRKMIGISKDTIIVSDHTKFGKSCLFQVAALQEIQAIITDKKADKKTVEGISDLGVKIILS